MNVTKSSGSLEAFDISKIKKVIAWGTRGLDIDPLKLESKIDISFHEAISTAKIQKNLEIHAAALTTLEEPEWVKAAGNFKMMSLWKKLGSNKERTFVDYIYKQVENKYYTDDLILYYTEEELLEAGSFIDVQRDLLYDYAGAIKLCNSYLLKDESPQQMYMAISLLLGIGKGLEFVNQVYEAISLKKISLATPFLGNLRKPDSNLSSCFIISTEDSLDGITTLWKNAANISKNGGGVGIHLSNIRAKGATIQNTIGASSGVVPLIKTLNDIATYINQLGKRSGAFTIALDIWHYDLLQFLELQTENGDPRTKAMDIQPQLVICDEFMRRDKNDEDWYLFDPHEVKTKLNIDLVSLFGIEFSKAYDKCINNLDKLQIVKKIKARAITKLIIRNYLETGLPYLAFKDTINEANPNSHAGYIPCTNLCVESYSVLEAGKTAHTCNLASLNLAEITSIDELKYMASLATRILDYSIELTSVPIEESAVHNALYRTIGVGAMGLADWLAKNKVSYTNDKGAISNLFMNIQYACIAESIQLAKEYGSYIEFKNSKWDTGELITKYKSQNNSLDWDYLQDGISTYGIRNSQLTAIAPNTSTSLLHGCSASILPVYSKLYYDNNSSGVVPIVAKYIKDNLWVYIEYKNIQHTKMNSIIADIQQWVDTGISYEIVLDLNKDIDAKYIYDVIHDAWNKKIKALYYVRSIQQNSDVKCEACEG